MEIELRKVECTKEWGDGDIVKLFWQSSEFFISTKA